jgi:hypothetical protein
MTGAAGLVLSALSALVGFTPGFTPGFTRGAAAHGSTEVASAVVPGPAREDAPWTAREAEHLLDRAGFGARPAEIAYAVRRGREAFVQELLDGYPDEVEPFFFDPPTPPKQRYTDDMSDEAKREIRVQFKRDDRDELGHFAGWWIGQMLDGPHPLRERMTLFWHGYFTSSYREVKLGGPMIRQNELFRAHALGSFRELLGEVIRDPAMVLYLDNDKNRKDNPNENLARELMELFTLGEGHYTEHDVKEAARCLTGFAARYDTGVTFRPGRHDRGKKEVLGVSGRLDADDLLRILLDDEQCPRWLAARTTSCVPSSTSCSAIRSSTPTRSSAGASPVRSTTWWGPRAASGCGRRRASCGWPPVSSASACSTRPTSRAGRADRPGSPPRRCSSAATWPGCCWGWCGWRT